MAEEVQDQVTDTTDGAVIADPPADNTDPIEELALEKGWSRNAVGAKR